SQGHDRFLTTDTERRKMRADCVGDIGRGQVRVVLFGHPRVRMTELRGDDTQANTLHRQVACMSMTQHMKSHRRGYFCDLACVVKRPLLVRPSPWHPIVTEENVRACGASHCPGGEQRPTLAGQDHMTWLTSLSLPDCQRIAVSIEVRAPQICKLGIS